jgi:hypothetical protein
MKVAPLNPAAAFFPVAWWLYKGEQIQTHCAVHLIAAISTAPTSLSES